MRRRRPEIQKIKLNLTPMLDMFTFVLIFLIVLFAPEEAKLSQDPHTELPEASLKLPSGDATHLEIIGENIKINSKIVLGLNIRDNSESSWTYLSSALKKAATSKQTILISADKNTPYEKIDAVVSHLSRFGYGQIHFLTLRKDEAPKSAAVQTKGEFK